MGALLAGPTAVIEGARVMAVVAAILKSRARGRSRSATRTTTVWRSRKDEAQTEEGTQWGVRSNVNYLAGRVPQPNGG